MWRQIKRQLRGETMLPFRYRDFGSLVSLGKYSTVGSLMGFLVGRGLFVEGLFARLMYHGLRVGHDRAVNGSRYALIALLARALSRRTGPVVKLH
jgi:NADH dehydrogenase